MKKISRQSAIGEAGVALVAMRLSDMCHQWHPTSGIDSGIDGEIEVRDPATAITRNFRIGVQVKATEGVWRSETEHGFLYRVKPADVEFWLSSNQPVLLVCARPKKGEAYWRNVQEWAADPKRRAEGLIDFDKRRDIFDASAVARFFSLRAEDGATVEPPGPEPRSDPVKSNLMPVCFDTEVVSSIATPSEDPKEIFELGLAAGVPHGDVILREGRLWTLAEFERGYLEAIGARSRVRREKLADWALSGNRSRQAHVAELLRRSLLDRLHRDLRWYQPRRIAYFRLWKDGERRRLAWAGRRSGRTVVLPRQSLKHEGLSGYRHDAAELAFRTLGGAWYMTVVPTYLFTLDGAKVSSFHAEALKKMKAIDRAAAVSQQLRMWEWLFMRPVRVEEAHAPLPPFHLAGLVELSVPVTPPEGAWRKPPTDLRDEDQTEDEDQISLLPAELDS
ncbi:MAG: DUF4365 domain-containing protein [Solirubrobacteraceae bacterium]